MPPGGIARTGLLRTRPGTGFLLGRVHLGARRQSGLRRTELCEVVVIGMCGLVLATGIVC